MSWPRVTTYLFAVATSLLNNCNQPQIDFPDSALAIEGTYKADTFSNKAGLSGFYPIQGQTMTLKVTRVATDSVRVEIEAPPNGDYSPGSNRVYNKLVVDQEYDTQLINKQQVTCLIYSVGLPASAGRSTSGERLRRLCKLSGLYYYFISPGSKVEAVVYFYKL